MMIKHTSTAMQAEETDKKGEDRDVFNWFACMMVNGVLWFGFTMMLWALNCDTTSWRPGPIVFLIFGVAVGLLSIFVGYMAACPKEEIGSSFMP